MSYRKMVQRPRVKNITQGSIFNFAQADIQSNRVLGMVLSARCDMAQFKQERFLYVPLIRATEWVDIFLVPKMLDEMKKSLLGELKSILSKNSQSPNAISTFGPEASAKLIVGHKDEKLYLDKLNKIKKIEKNASEGIFDKAMLNTKAVASKISDIIGNKVEGYFFIDEVIDFHDADRSMGSYIVDLSDPRPLHKSTAQMISEGLFHTNINEALRIYDAVYKTKDEMSYVLCDVMSPYVELVLQRFAYFYSRIGVEDPSIKLKEDLVSEIMQ
ncbi:hypothetical protein [Aeromonas salmonicida]